VDLAFEFVDDAEVTISFDMSLDRPMLLWKRNGNHLHNWHLQRITESGNLWITEEMRRK